jgi:hypothetical protein
MNMNEYAKHIPCLTYLDIVGLLESAKCWKCEQEKESSYHILF